MAGFIGGALGYHVLRYLSRHVAPETRCDGSTYHNRSKLESLLGSDFWEVVIGKVVIDFGCGTGREAIEIAQHGTRRVIGIDVRSDVLEQARQQAEREGVSEQCVFTTDTSEKADVIVSIDGFEHYQSPERILRLMGEMIKPDGRVEIAFGAPWYHPWGGHLFSIFPWAHLIFTEKALIRWRSDFKTDGATRFSEVAGGLNQMTIHRFRRLLDESPFRIERFELIPIKAVRILSNRLTRELFTSVVRCTLIPRTTPGVGI